MRKFKGRVVRPNAFARRSLEKLYLRLQWSKPNDWPQHLLSAWRIINGQPGLSETEALSVIIDSVAAAHGCVVAENQRANRIGEVEALKEVLNACGRVLKRIQDDRAEVSEVSTKLRRRLDKEILPLIRQPVIDLEVIQSIFETAAKVFDDFPVSGPSLSNLLREVGKDYFSNLSATLRRELEQVITDLGARSKTKRFSTEALFKALAKTLPAKKTLKIETATHQLRSHYVDEVAEIWRHAGLKPSRAHNYLKVEYKSRFHRFADFVLAAIAEPQTQRHDDNINEPVRAVEHARADLCEVLYLGEIPEASTELRRIDRQWLISDDHLKTGFEIIRRDSIY